MKNYIELYIFSSIQFSHSVVSTLCDPMGYNMPGLPVHHQLPEFIQTHVHWVSDAIQLSHTLSSPSPLTFSHSQHQGLFQWVSSSHQVAKVLEFQLQHSPANEHSGLISFSLNYTYTYIPKVKYVCNPGDIWINLWLVLMPISWLWYCTIVIAEC